MWLKYEWRELAEVVGGSSSPQRVQGAKLPGRCGGMRGCLSLSYAHFLCIDSLMDSVGWYSQDSATFPSEESSVTKHLLRGKWDVKRAAPHF